MQQFRLAEELFKPPYETLLVAVATLHVRSKENVSSMKFLAQLPSKASPKLPSKTIEELQPQSYAVMTLVRRNQHRYQPRSR